TTCCSSPRLQWRFLRRFEMTESIHRISQDCDRPRNPSQVHSRLGNGSRHANDQWQLSREPLPSQLPPPYMRDNCGIIKAEIVARPRQLAGARVARQALFSRVDRLSPDV